MKIILNENQLSGLKKNLEDSIYDVGVYETLRRYNLNLKTLSVIFKGDMPDISCSDLYYIISKEIRILSSKKHIYNNFSFDFDFCNFSGSLTFVCEKIDLEYSEFLYGYATPYWNGDCYLPIEFENYEWFYENDNERNQENLSGEYFYSEELQTEFDSFNEIRSWLEKDYIKILSEKCEEVFNYLKED